MKKILAISGLLTVLAMPAMAQSYQGEQQVYYPPYITNTAITQQDLVARQNYIVAQQQARLQNNYIERDPTASYRGRIPHHPGDYRDAFDRGELPNLGSTAKTNTPPGR